jgi:hypothetical protein
MPRPWQKRYWPWCEAAFDIAELILLCFPPFWLDGEAEFL